MIKINNRRYLGSKHKLLQYIRQIVEANCVDCSSFLDLFAGTGVVASEFNRDFKILVNDLLQSNFKNYQTFFSADEIDLAKIARIIEEYNLLDPQQLADNYYSLNFADTYLSRDNLKIIGYIRDDIDLKLHQKEINEREHAFLLTSSIYAVDKIANTVGHYDAYRKNGSLDKKIHFQLPEANSEFNQGNQIFNRDANDLVKEIQADIVYIDPPYNSRQYGDAYHFLENLATNEKPEVFGVARKMNRDALKSDYCTTKASQSFKQLIADIQAKYILVSYNNTENKINSRSNSKISDADIISILTAKGRTSVFEIDFKAFTTGKSVVNDHAERIFLCEVGNFNHTLPHKIVAHFKNEVVKVEDYIQEHLPSTAPQNKGRVIKAQVKQSNPNPDKATSKKSKLVETSTLENTKLEKPKTTPTKSPESLVNPLADNKATDNELNTNKLKTNKTTDNKSTDNKTTDSKPIWALNADWIHDAEQSANKANKTSKANKITKHNSASSIHDNLSSVTTDKVTLADSYQETAIDFSEIIKSPLNYTGGKGKLIPIFKELFPEDITTFYDVFSGGANVAVNFKADKTICIDNNDKLIELFNFLKNSDPFSLLEQIDAVIDKFGLSNSFVYGYEYYGCNSSNGLGKYNKEPFERLKAIYNSRISVPEYNSQGHNSVAHKSTESNFGEQDNLQSQEPIELLFLLLIIFSFNNQIRFNSSGKFNLPVGKRDFNASLRRKLTTFIQRIQQMDIEFRAADFRSLDVAQLSSENTFLYLDPPYILGLASYNEANGWTAQDEADLLEFLTGCHEHKIKFALSNVVKHKGKYHNQLIEWAIDQAFKIHFLDHNYKNSNYQLKDRSEDSREVLITNY